MGGFFGFFFCFLILDLSQNSVWEAAHRGKSGLPRCVPHMLGMSYLGPLVCWRPGDLSVNEQIGKHKERFGSHGFTLV